jgi:hypothetical protein
MKAGNEIFSLAFGRGRQRRMSGRIHNHVPVFDFDRDLAQSIATAWSGNAFAMDELEAGTVHCADKQAFLAPEEFPRGPIEPSAGMRAYIEPRAYVVAIAMDDDRFDSAFDATQDLNHAAISDRIQRRQNACNRCLMVKV